jgi:hypothetical protein
MNNKNKINYKEINIYVIIAIIIVLFIGIKIGNCEPRKRKDEFTIRVFKQGIVEEMKSLERYYFDYTGVEYGFDIRVYCNGKEIYSRTLEDTIKNQGSGSMFTVRCNYYEFYGESYKAGNRLPEEKGKYAYYIDFNRMYIWEDDILQKHDLKDFYFCFYIDYDYFMSTKE